MGIVAWSESRIYCSMFGPTYCGRGKSCLEGSLAETEFFPRCQKSSLAPLLGRKVRRWIVKGRNTCCRRRVASAFASVPLCVASQPFKTKDKKEAPYDVLDNVEVEGDVPGPGEPTGRWRPSRAVGVMSRGSGGTCWTCSMVAQGARAHLRRLKLVVGTCIFECLASAAARVMRETRMRALLLLGKRQECLKC